MEISVLFFGAAADAVGSQKLKFNLDEPTTASFLIDKLSKRHSSLANHKLLIAVNEQYANPDTILNDGDEVALFTAVSGG